MIRCIYFMLFCAVLFNCGAFAQTIRFEVTGSSGLSCTFDNSGNRQGWIYEIKDYVFDYTNNYSVRYCCEEAVQPSITNRAQCASYCESRGWPWEYGVLRDREYISCACLNPCGSPIEGNDAYYRALVFYNDNAAGYVPIPQGKNVPFFFSKSGLLDVRDLATRAAYTVDIPVQDDRYTPLSLLPQQTARLRSTVSWENGNSAEIHALGSVRGVTTGTIGFTIRSLFDHRASFNDFQLRNHSLTVSYLANYYSPPVQTKRQATSYFWTYYLKNTGSDIQDVLAAGSEIVASWHFSPQAINTDSSIISIIGNFQFDLNIQFNASLLNRCGDSALPKQVTCGDGYHLDYCENNTLARKLCHLGCDYFSGQPLSQCLPCNTTTCQGTCVPTATSSRCECSGMSVGAGCELDLATSTLHFGLSERDAEQLVWFYADIENCEVGKNCATFTHGMPSTNYGGIFRPGYCCAAAFNLTKLERNFTSTALLFARTSEWSCFLSAKDQIEMKFLYDTYEIYPPQLVRYAPFWRYQRHLTTQMDVYTEPYLICNSQVNGTNDPRTAAASAAVRDPVSATFVGTSGAAVAVGFIVGFIVKPEGMALVGKKPKGCLPKGEKGFARSILAIIIIDVVLVTAFGIVGLNYPISLLVFASGIMLIISSKLVKMIASRFIKTKIVRQLAIVQNVFGSFAGAFLIVFGLGFFLLGLGEYISELSIVLQYSGAILPWLMLGTYCMWAFVIVHFATAIQVCVSCYFSLMKQKSTAVKQDQIEMTQQASSNSSDSEESYQNQVALPVAHTMETSSKNSSGSRSDSAEESRSDSPSEPQSEISKEESKSASNSASENLYDDCSQKEASGSEESSEGSSAVQGENSSRTSSSAESNSLSN